MQAKKILTPGIILKTLIGIDWSQKALYFYHFWGNSGPVSGRKVSFLGGGGTVSVHPSAFVEATLCTTSTVPQGKRFRGSSSKITWVRVKGHIGQGQIRVLGRDLPEHRAANL